MENKYFGSKFYSSWLNTILLFVLIVLMVIALRFMYKNQETYLPILQQKEQNVINNTEILGNKDDLVAFSIMPNTKVHGIVSYRGIVKGGYFFEANILVNVLDSNKNSLIKGYATSKDDWMTAGPVNFEGNIDFSNLAPGNAYIEIHNDNASGLPENDKNILIPIIIE